MIKFNYTFQEFKDLLFNNFSDYILVNLYHNNKQYMKLKIKIKDSDKEIIINESDIVNLEILDRSEPFGLRNYFMQISGDVIAGNMLLCKSDAPGSCSELESLNRVNHFIEKSDFVVIMFLHN